MTEHSRESLQILGLNVEQPVKGARFSLDPFLLAFFVSGFAPRRVLEIGAGVGIAGLVLARRCPGLRELEMVEVQSGLADLARRNVEKNDLGRVRVTVRNEDARYVAVRNTPDMIMCNPPYRDFRSGRVSPLKERAISRHWYFLGPADIFRIARRLLAESGLLCMILPAPQCEHWDQFASPAGFFRRVTWPVVPRAKESESFFVMAYGRSGSSQERNPLILHGRDGKYTPEAAEILGIF